MPKTRINCPNCRQPLVADVEQLFDVGKDPGAKQRLLSGAFNHIQCPNCGYQGNLDTVIVYHDPDKELLLTYQPPTINMPRNEQERLIGSLTNQVINNLPQEKRKGYLFRPQAMLTLQGMIEKVLEGEGVTKEMIQAQQQRLSLIQRLANITSEDALAEVVKQEDSLIDAETFTLLRRLIDASVMGGDQQSAQVLAKLHQSLLDHSTFGSELKAQSQEVEAAVKDLQKAGKSLDREKLLDLVENAPGETRQRAYVSLARPLMDYSFFQLLTERIESASAERRPDLEALRGRLLEWTRELDQQVEARAQAARQLLQEILKADDISEAILHNLPAIDEFFLEELNRAQEEARKSGNLDRISKLQQAVQVLQQVSSSAQPEMALIEELMEAQGESARKEILEAHQEEVTPDFLNALANIAGQVEGSEDKEVAREVKAIYRQVLRFSMEKNLNQ